MFQLAQFSGKKKKKRKNDEKWRDEHGTGQFTFPSHGAYIQIEIPDAMVYHAYPFLVLIV